MYVPCVMMYQLLLVVIQIPPGTREDGNVTSDNKDSEEALALSRTKVEEFITPQPRHDHDQDQASGLIKEEGERYDIGTELVVPVQEQRRSTTQVRNNPRATNNSWLN